MLTDFRYSRDRTNKQNLQLVTMGFPDATEYATRLGFWKLYLRAHGLPETNIIGDSLPDALRDRQGSEVMGATALPVLTGITLYLQDIETKIDLIREG